MNEHMPQEFFWVEFKHINENKRQISISYRYKTKIDGKLHIYRLKLPQKKFSR